MNNEQYKSSEGIFNTIIENAEYVLNTFIASNFIFNAFIQFVKLQVNQFDLFTLLHLFYISQIVNNNQNEVFLYEWQAKEIGSEYETSTKEQIIGVCTLKNNTTKKFYKYQIIGVIPKRTRQNSYRMIMQQAKLRNIWDVLKEHLSKYYNFFECSSPQKQAIDLDNRKIYVFEKTKTIELLLLAEIALNFKNNQDFWNANNQETTTMTLIWLHSFYNAHLKNSAKLSKLTKLLNFLNNDELNSIKIEILQKTFDLALKIFNKIGHSDETFKLMTEK
ncbi:hypothetical protein H9M94_01080 [Mycoplasma sp. Pen4]|uniref:hypothetical protein n=1 Tax=Mycoplasma sp. Pen4 TaxID=640330 RepID=UPI001653FB51|nr:hypothetical protein [Mycoplasma sp. Pen4]QNM93756.1 hypothetical protein H9M94_00565 [Mycoplasma sp. Pen4]QNM93852.1 hypothetical protein H9M94_01080 [Mycoplasma sp. Pen4]